MIYGDTVLITGASSGVGKIIAQTLMENGYKVYGTSRKPIETSSQIIRNTKNGKGFIEMITLDVRSDDSIKRAVEYVVKKEGKIDILINNAGFGIAGAIEDTSPEEAFEQFDTNFFGILRMCRNIIPIMRANKNGLIINISSVAGLISIPFQSMYSASKYALEAFSQALRIELKPFGINVVLIEPGDMKTGFTSNRKVVKAANESSVYKEQFTRSLNTMIKDEMTSPSPGIVAKAVIKLLKMRKPPVRIVIGIKYKIIVFLKRLLPARFVEYVVSRIY
jgi:short-subunit dehydrogenase